MTSLLDFGLPFLRCLPAETAHNLAIRGLAALPGSSAPVPETRPCELAGLRLPNPVGLAAGFDKNAQVPHKIQQYGFGFVEVGTVTPLPQRGNPRPRLFRLREDRAVINRMGFNNAGAEAVRRNVERARPHMKVPLGVNIGANKDTEDKVQDYVRGVEIFGPLADYLTVNISSPNTAGLRDLQSQDHFARLIEAVLRARLSIHRAGIPVFFKLAPDLTPDQIEFLAELALNYKLDGLILTNTTITRPDSLKSPHRDETGGLSGEPLKDLSLRTLKSFHEALGDKVPLISAGGISSRADVEVRLAAGAKAVQLYSALVYHGLGLAKKLA